MRSIKLTPHVWRLTRSSILTLSLLALSLTLGACATTRTGSQGTNVACESFNPVRWSHKDTPGTIEQSVGNNAAGVALCPYDPKWRPKRGK